MSSYQQAVMASYAEPSERAMFIRRTYGHLAMAILLFVIVESILLKPEIAEPLCRTMLSGQYSWLIVLAAFMGISHLANWWANNQASTGMQYLGLVTYVLAEAVIFVPILYIAQNHMPGVINQAAIITLAMFGGLTFTVFFTRKDFSFLGPILTMGGFIALGFIACAIIFGFNLGTLFSVVMIAFASAAILYDTSNIMKRYNTNQHVAASLSLFASVALLFWYILRLLMSLTRD